MADIIDFPRRKRRVRTPRVPRVRRPRSPEDFFPYTTPEDGGGRDGSVVDSAEQSHTNLTKVIQTYRTPPNGPFHFMQDWLGIDPNPWPDDKPPPGWDGVKSPLWSQQREILENLFLHKKLAVKSGNGVGKTHTAAVAVLTMLYVHRALVISTAPTFRQVKRALWGEIHFLYAQANRFLGPKGQELGGTLNTMDLQLGPKWYAIGFSTDDSDFFQGFHEETIFLVVDEACGWSKELYNAAEGILTSENSYVLLIGNPTDPTSEFAEKFRPGSEYHKMTIPCTATPNVRHGSTIYPKLVAHDWPDRKRRQWGEQSPMYKARVAAEFPEEREDTLIPYRYLQAALDKELPDDSMIISYGLDVARFGDDSTVMGRRRANGQYRAVWSHQGKATTQTTGRAIYTWNEECNNEDQQWQAPINVDDIGLGGGVTDQLLEEGIPCNGINVGEAGFEVEDDDEHPEKFLNQRAQFFWRLRKVFMKGEVDIDDEELAEQLSRILYDFQRGKIRIHAKDSYKKLYGHSPDKADAMMLAWAAAEYEEEGRVLARWL